jgi:phosphoserine phosphatase
LCSAQAPDRIAARIAGDPPIESRILRDTIAETILGLARRPRDRMAAAGDDAPIMRCSTAGTVDEFCAPSTGATSPSAWSSGKLLLTACPSPAHLAQVPRRRLHRRELVRAGSPAVARHRAVALGRAGPQEGMADPLAPRARHARPRRAARGQPRRGDGTPLGRLGLTIRAVLLSNPLAGVDVDKPRTMRSPKHPRRASMSDLAIYDMDRTVTRAATYTPFLLHCALRRAPWRLLLLPLVILSMLAYAARLIDRARLKEINHRLLLGGRIQPGKLRPLVESFADAQVETNVRPGALAALARDKADGRRLVLATASYRLYADAIAERLGFDDVIGTGSVIGLDEMVHAKILGENCYGPAKLRMIADWVEKSGLKGATATSASIPTSVRPAGIRMGGRADRGEPAWQTPPPRVRARVGHRGLGLRPGAPLGGRRRVYDKRFHGYFKISVSCYVVETQIKFQFIRISILKTPKISFLFLSCCCADEAISLI